MFVNLKAAQVQGFKELYLSFQHMLTGDGTKFVSLVPEQPKCTKV